MLGVQFKGIDIPKSLENILIDSGEDYDRKVKTLIKNTHDYFTEYAEFFPEYTFHGKKHINNILEISAKLIPENTELTARDAAIYINAVMVHDIGMFMTLAGFEKLFLKKEPYKKIKYLDDKSWSELWEDYGKKLKRYTSKQLLRSFGTNQNVKIPSEIKRDNLTELDKRVCGEFLRQNHGRLAQDVVLFGFLGGDTVDIFKNTDFTDEERKLIGIIARSHTMKVRDTEEYLNNTFGNKAFPDAVPAIYLMCLLRLADYIDAEKNRAPKNIESARDLQSQISRDEWEWNQAIERHTFYPKKDLLKIYASPKRSTVYVKLKNWIYDVQHELDKCHALLAEHYENEYTLSIHRVTSDILNKKYTDNLDFVTKEAKLTANPDITKLLIAPLYGNNPTYGVRELIQNATDACRERKEIEKQNGNTDYKGEVTVKLSTVEKTFTITDNGIGMNEDVILNYYLVAGSSYRSSQTWQDKFAPDGDSVITRGGKFGVGFLATFLLGNTVEVTTRHKNDNRGYHFTFSNDYDIIDIERVDEDECEIGTTITVKDLKDSIIENFTKNNNEPYISIPNFTDWYRFKEPAITYYIDDEEIKTKLSYVPDETDDEEFGDWITIPKDKCAGFDCVKFRYDPRINLKPIRNECFYNGIRSTVISGYSITKPFFSLIDKNNLADIDLARNQLEIPREIFKEVDKYFWADILTFDEEIIKTTNLFLYDYDLLYSKYGYTLFEAIYKPSECVTVPIPDKYTLNIYPLINKCNKPFMFGKEFSKKTKNRSRFCLFFKIMLIKYDELKGLTDGSTWIPYSMKNRQKKFKKTFEELAPYIEAIKKARANDKEYQDMLKKAKNGEYPEYPVELYEKFMSLPEEYKQKGVEPEEIDIILKKLNKNE